jgi:hypothetical protein
MVYAFSVDVFSRNSKETETELIATFSTATSTWTNPGWTRASGVNTRRQPPEVRFVSVQYPYWVTDEGIKYDQK